MPPPTLCSADISKTIACSHTRATEFFTASISDNDFLACPCPGEDDYDHGRCEQCGQGCNHMGYRASPLRPGLYFLHTGAVYPFLP